jgi:hypothetical protein
VISSPVLLPDEAHERGASKSDDEELMELFRQAHRQAPIIGEGAPPSNKPIRIRVLLFEHKIRNMRFRDDHATASISDEVLNICMDGFERSPHFELVNATVVPDYTVRPDFVLKEDEDVVWVADMRRTIFGHSYTIAAQLVVAAQATLNYQREHQKGQPSLKVVLMNYRDRIPEKTLCTRGVQELTNLLGEGNVRLVLQQVVRGREWNPGNNFPAAGRVWDPRPDATCFGRPILHAPYTVRSDYAEAFAEQLRAHLPDDGVLRPTDVAHFWSRQTGGHAHLRNAVTSLLQSMNESDTEWKVIAGFVSMAAKTGRVRVSLEYVQALLSTKIVVVAQRDHWEDHYRLFEAFAGGAMVMTDPMLSLPEGLVDRENVVIYHSLQELEQLLLYYLDPASEQERLQIARKGWELAMTQHRTYHWMEKLFFGKPLTP